MGPVLLCARLGGMAVSAHRTQTRSVSAYRRPECLLKSRMCERHLSGYERAWAATFGEHPVYSTTALVWRSLLCRRRLTGGAADDSSVLPGQKLKFCVRFVGATASCCLEFGDVAGTTVRVSFSQGRRPGVQRPGL